MHDAPREPEEGKQDHDAIDVGCPADHVESEPAQQGGDLDALQASVDKLSTENALVKEQHRRDLDALQSELDKVGHIPRTNATPRVSSQCSGRVVRWGELGGAGWGAGWRAG